MPVDQLPGRKGVHIRDGGPCQDEGMNGGMGGGRGTPKHTSSTVSMQDLSPCLICYQRLPRIWLNMSGPPHISGFIPLPWQGQWSKSTRSRNILHFMTHQCVYIRSTTSYLQRDPPPPPPPKVLISCMLGNWILMQRVIFFRLSNRISCTKSMMRLDTS